MALFTINVIKFIEKTFTHNVTTMWMSGSNHYMAKILIVRSYYESKRKR